MKRVRKPGSWTVDERFNPFIVGSKRKLALYSHAISRALQGMTYKPMPALVREVAKSGGGTRSINEFQVPDSAVSTMVFRSLSIKNTSRLSAHAFAYRQDRTPHDAVFGIHHEWRKLKRVYVAEFDFSKFFDLIDHGAIWRILGEGPFLASDRERHVIGAFLASESAHWNDYVADRFTERKRGIPQGTSVSLFLANLVCWELDRELERLGVGFSRFADDTLVWSPDYPRIVEAFDVINRYSRAIGVPLNLRKSEGISLVTTAGLDGEIAHKTHVDFLGYQISLGQIGVKQANIEKAKKRISYIAYQNLIQPLRRGVFNHSRIRPPVDLDLITALGQVRSYLYGGLDDDKLLAYIRGASPSINFRGFMSYYPIVTDTDQLRRLDGWVLHVFKNALRLRARLWLAHDGSGLPGPHSGWIDRLDEIGAVTAGGATFDLRVPRFSLIARAMAASITDRGIAATANPASAYY